MAYRILVAGVPIECDSADEALEIARRAAEISGVSVLPGQRDDSNPSGSRWSENRVREFFKLVKGPQRKIIDILLMHSDGRTDIQLLQELGLGDDGRRLGGILAGLWKNARKVGADPKDLVDKKPIMIGDNRSREYTLSNSFRKAAEGLSKNGAK